MSCPSWLLIKALTRSFSEDFKRGHTDWLKKKRKCFDWEHKPSFLDRWEPVANSITHKQWLVWEKPEAKLAVGFFKTRKKKKTTTLGCYCEIHILLFFWVLFGHLWISNTNDLCFCLKLWCFHKVIIFLRLHSNSNTHNTHTTHTLFILDALQPLPVADRQSII